MLHLPVDPAVRGPRVHPHLHAGPILSRIAPHGLWGCEGLVYRIDGIVISGARVDLGQVVGAVHSFLLPSWIYSYFHLVMIAPHF